MPDQQIIDDLIASYRELNHRIRGMNFAGNTDSTIAILQRMRDRELTASQSIKQLLLGGDVSDDDEPAVLSEHAQEVATSPEVMLSQFGTAREATLSLVRDLPDEQWSQVYKTPRGEMSLRDYLLTLVERDRERMQELEAQLPRATA